MCAGWVCYHRYHLKDERYGLSFFLPSSTIATVPRSFTAQASLSWLVRRCL
jgi:hypothetical protein